MTVFKKSLLTLGLAALAFSAILVISILVFMNSLYYEVNTTALKNTSYALINSIGRDYIVSVFTERNEPADIILNENDAYRLTLIELSGYVLWDSHVAGDLVNHIDREEIISALQGIEASSRRRSLSTNEEQLYYAIPVYDNRNNITGVFRLSVNVPDFLTRISSVLIPFINFALALVIAVFFAIIAFSRSLSSSLGRLVKITQTGTSLLSGPEAEETIAPEFRSLEKAIRAMTTELNLRLEQAKAEGRRLEAILNGMTEAVFAMDSGLNLHLVNPSARKIFNLGDADIKGMTLLEATRSSDIVDAARKALASDSSLDFELTFRSGNEQQFQVYATPLAANGIKNGVVLVLLDITRLVKLERVRKDFVANVSHELRTPIQLIKGFSETLLDTVSDDDLSAAKSVKKQIIHFIKIIQKNASTMENLTNDLLILADLENNGNIDRRRDMEELKILNLIDEAVSSVEIQAKKKQIEIDVDCSDKIKACLFGFFIIQALINMIDNAIKYSPEKSKVKVSAYCKKDANDNEELVIEVKDKGIGIPQEHLERIFERFYRIDRARSREEGGTGLGLSIVRHIAVLHNGRAEAESRAGEGSSFRIVIPQVT